MNDTTTSYTIPLLDGAGHAVLLLPEEPISRANIGQIRSWLNWAENAIAATTPGDRHASYDHLLENLTPKDVLEAVSRTFHTRPEQLKSARRDQRLVWVRHVAAYMLRDVLEESFSVVGSILGGRDHSTISHSVHKVEDRLAKDNAFAALVERAYQELGL